jgi:hypothetical protein
MTDAIKTAKKRQPKGTGEAKSSPATPSQSAQAVVATPQFREGSKQALLANLLSREGGASITELTDATGWQPHTTRAAITGLRKRGCDISTDKVDGVFRYRMGDRANG